MKQLKTRRLLLEPMHEDALRRLMESETDPHMHAAYGEMLAGLRAHPADWVFHTEWSILLRAGEKRIGGLGFKGAPEDGAVDIGYGIDAPYRGRGYAKEAVSAAVEWAFLQNGVSFVTAEAEENNAASRHILEKLGFVPCGRGDEGVLYEKARPTAYWTAVLAGVGFALGAMIGLPFGWLLPGICIGISAGLLLGYLFDRPRRRALAACRSLRAAARARRNGPPEGPAAN